MISEKDELFECPKSLYDKDKNAYTYVGWEGTEHTAFEIMADGYFSAAEAVYQKFQNSAGEYRILDSIGYPICFLYRHYMELSIKGLFFKYAEEGRRKGFLKKKHSLNALWNSTEPILQKLQKRVESTVNISALRRYIEQMHDFDTQSFSMRYPIDVDLNPMRPESLKINIVNLHDRMQDFHLALQKLDEEISDQIMFDIPEDELSAIQQKVQRYRKEIRMCLELIKKASESPKKTNESDDFFQQYILGEHYSNEKLELLQFIKKQDFDFKHLIYDIFYCGRDVCPHHLPVAATDRKKDVLKVLAVKESLVVTEGAVMDLFDSKNKSLLFQCIHRTMKELGVVTGEN